MSDLLSIFGADTRSAGQLLRDARHVAGLDVAVLAAQLKVPAAKIEALETDRFDQLPGVAFTRALALSMARALKIDPAPVLSRLPKASGDTLDDVSRGLNAPFRAGHGLLAGIDLGLIRRPIVWGPFAVLMAAFALWMMPVTPIGTSASNLMKSLPGAGTGGTPVAPVAAPAADPATLPPALPSAAGGDASAQAPAAPPALAVPSAPVQPTVEIVHSAPPAAASASGVEGLSGDRPLQLRAGAASWVEVRDAKGSLLLSRTLQPGETISLAGALPLKAVVGNAADTTAIVHGRDFNIAAHTQGNVARFEVR
jgi:cytoskeleton protein RodZ